MRTRRVIWGVGAGLVVAWLCCLPRHLFKDVSYSTVVESAEGELLGARIAADEALARSLNVPAVYLLREYGVPKFHALLQEARLSTLTHDAAHYGLSLILGGAEARLDEVTAAYAGMVRRFQGQKEGDLPPSGGPKGASGARQGDIAPQLAIWYTLEALQGVNRPDELDWRLIRSVRKAAWKTGTSYGFRDAWAVGMTPTYTIGVWAGNAQGQGVPGLTGARAAGPVMFDILNLLPADEGWFEMPDQVGHDVFADVCTASGMLATENCPSESLLIPAAGLETPPALTTAVGNSYCLRPWSGTTSPIIRSTAGWFGRHRPRRLWLSSILPLAPPSPCPAS